MKKDIFPLDGDRDLLSVESKISIANLVIADAFKAFRRPFVLCNGSSDSILLLHLIHEARSSAGSLLPPVVFIEHGKNFEQSYDFLKKLSGDWNFQLLRVVNQNVMDHLDENRRTFRVKDLDEENQKEAGKFSSSPPNEVLDLSSESEILDHLTQTLPLYKIIRRYRFDSILLSSRKETVSDCKKLAFNAPLKEVACTAIQPMIPFMSSEVWNCTLKWKLPIHPMYEKGFRDVENKFSNPSEKRIWEDEFDPGRTKGVAMSGEDEERVSERLKRLGYM